MIKPNLQACLFLAPFCDLSLFYAYHRIWAARMGFFKQFFNWLARNVFTATNRLHSLDSACFQSQPFSVPFACQSFIAEWMVCKSMCDINSNHSSFFYRHWMFPFDVAILVSSFRLRYRARFACSHSLGLILSHSPSAHYLAHLMVSLKFRTFHQINPNEFVFVLIGFSTHTSFCSFLEKCSWDLYQTS